MTTTFTAPGRTRPYGARHRWVVLAVGVGAQGSFSAMFSGIPVTGVVLRAGYHLSTASLGAVLACLALGVAASDVVWGLLTDRWGDRRVLLTGMTGLGMLLVAMTAAVTPPDGAGTVLLGACLLAAGALGGSVNAASGRAIMTWFGDGERGLAMGIRQTAIPVGGAVGVALLPWLAGTYGFRAAYAVPAALCLLSAAATWRWLHEPPSPSKPDPHGGPHPVAKTEAYGAGRSADASGTGDRPVKERSPLLRWDVWRLAVAGALLTVPQFAVLSFTAIFLHDARGQGSGPAAATVLIAQIGGGAVRIWTGRRTDRGGDRRAHVRGIGALSGVAMAAAAVLADAPILVTVGALAVGGVLANSWHGVAYTEIAAMAGTGRAGSALGLLGTALFGAGFATSLLVPVVLELTSWHAVWGLAAGAALLAVPLAPARVRSPRRAR
ncbi:MFS transporter [Nonomuraea terrae]|uniref:MFS transporter n=1 Tax=Nonomuraea terrae TaxID=2530383 RepID=UPI0037A4E162